MSLPTLFASLPIPAGLRPTAVLVRALNAVLAREPWAQQRLAQYAGRTVFLKVGALQLPLALTHAATLVLTDGSETADVQLTIEANKLKALPTVLAQSDPEALLALIHIQGDAGLANALAQVVSQLRFDPEAEIARFTGDLFAVRLVATVKQLMQSGQRTARHVEGNMAEFLGEESGILVSTDYYQIWQARFTQLEQRLTDLEQRTAQLSKG